LYPLLYDACSLNKTTIIHSLLQTHKSHNYMFLLIVLRALRSRRRSLERPNALEADPVSLSIHDKSAVRGKALFPPNNLPLFGGIRDAAAQAIRRYCHESVIRENNRELFDRLIFNIFVSNDDDHLRNHGFVWDVRLPGWRLSPLYDVMPRASLASERRLHLGVGPEGRSATLDNALAGRETFTLSTDTAAQSISRIWKTVREWKVLFEEYDVPADQIEKIAPAFRHIDEVSTPALRKLIP